MCMSCPGGQSHQITDSPEQVERLSLNFSQPRTSGDELQSEDRGHRQSSHIGLSSTFPCSSKPRSARSQSSRNKIWASEVLTGLVTPTTPIREPLNFRQQVKDILQQWHHPLFIAIPISWALHFTVPERFTLVFTVSFLATIPLVQLLGYATEQLSIRVGDALAGLIDATLGNTVGFIFATIALTKCELRMVQSSLVGSILSNLLLVLGLCFFAGGTRFYEQTFAVPTTVTKLDSSLLLLSVICVLIPAAVDIITRNRQIKGYDNNTEQWDIMKVSHGTALVLLFIYFLYLYFQLFTHRGLYSDETSTQLGTVQRAPRNGPTAAQEMRGVRKSPRCPQTAGDTERQAEGAGEQAVGEERELELSLWVAVVLLVVVMILVAVTAEWLVESIVGLTSGGKISKEFTGLILLPIISHGPEHADIIMASMKKEKLALIMRVAIGGSIQIMLLVTPCIIVIGWIDNKPITLHFDRFESTVLFFSVLMVNYIVQRGKSSWLEGMILISWYAIVAMGFWFYPGSEPTRIFDCSA